LCASTHVAVDNVLEKFLNEEDVIAVRIGDQKKISPEVRQFQIENRVETERKRIINHLSQKRSLSRSQEFLLRSLRSDPSNAVITNLILESANLICGTMMGILKHPEIQRNRGSPIYDYLIIDEASKTTFQEFLVPAILARRWIIVGDPRQLSPHVETMLVESNLSTLLDPIESKICNLLFKCKNYGLNLLFIEDDQRVIDHLITQAEFLELLVFNVNDVTSFDQSTKLEMLGSQIIAGSSENIEKIESSLPMDAFLIQGEMDLELFQRRNLYWLEHFSKQIKKKYEEKTWAEELAWRLARSFELRRTPDEQERYEKKISQLLPVFLSESQKSDFHDKLEMIKRIAFPSLVELLKDGFQRNRFQKGGTTLSDGFPNLALKNRYVLLSFQHRMHPDISEFPRKFIYDEEALQDPSYIKAERNWIYPQYNRRRIWLNIKGNDTENQNEQEADALIDELKRFLEWSHYNPRVDGRLWEIAVLTFYKKQENLLRERFQRIFRSKRYQTFKLSEKNAVLTLCTVDRFQGHEADIVFLSFVRNQKVGFLDCLNRLNVAITRARYQLVVIGNREFFQGKKNISKILRDLANNTEKIMKYRVRG